MHDCFVDVTWRGLEVGHRVKLRDVRGRTGYLDHGTPMPVGTELIIRTDEGLEVPISVVRIHEQVGGSTETPGMEIAPRLEGAAATWWAARTEPEPEPPAVVRSLEETRATARTLDATEAAAAAAQTVDVTAEAHAAAARTLDVTAEADAAGGDGTPEVIDDGRKTEVMSAVDVAAIVAQADRDAAASGDGDGDGNGNGNGNGDDSGEAAPAAKGKKRRPSRRRRKSKS